MGICKKSMITEPKRAIAIEENKGIIKTPQKQRISIEI
jgi:hypothetical protein